MNSSPAIHRDDFMLRRLSQVARTYFQISFWVEVPALMATIILINCLAPWSIPGRLGWAVVSMYQTSAAAMTVAGHLKSQVNDWRSSLTPGFRAPHLIVAGVAVALLIVLVPLSICAPLGLSASGMIALTLVMTVSLSWALYSPAAGIVLGVGSIVFFTHISHDFIFELGEGKHFGTADWIIAGCGAALILLWTCFSRMNGENQAYPNQPHDIHLRIKMTRNPTGRPIGVLEQWGDWAFDRFERRAKPGVRLRGAWSVIQQRRFISLQGMRPVLTGVLFVLLLAVILLVVQLMTGFLSNPKDAQDGTVMLFISALAWPILIVSISLPVRWPGLGGELLLPAARRDFVRQIGMASAIDLVTLWVSSASAALLICVGWFPRETYGGGRFIAAALAVSAASLVFNYGLLVWLTRLRHGLFSAAAMIIAMAAAIVPVLEPMHDLQRLNVAHVVVWIVALVSIGAALTFDAYRRWQQTEMD